MRNPLSRVFKTLLGGAALALVTAAPGLAQDLAGKRIGVVALYDNPFWTDACAGIEVVVGPLGVEIIALNSGGDAAQQATNVTNLVSAQVDGAIIGPVARQGPRPI